MRYLRKICALALCFVLGISALPLSTQATPEAYFWDFEDTAIGSLPAGFTVATRDSGIYELTISARFPEGVAASVTTNPLKADKCVVMGSWFTNPSIRADRWMITPAILVSGESPVLKWKGHSQDANYRESYNVLISTTGNQPEDFTTTLLSVVDEQGGSYANHSIALDAYAGQTVYIAFQLVSLDEFLLMLDDIYVGPQSVAFDVNAGPDQNIASGSSITLTASAIGGFGALTYIWQNASGNTIGNTQSTTVSPASSTFYTCLVTDSLGNSGSDSVNVTVYAPIEYQIQAAAGVGGTISPNGGTAVASGSSLTYTITPNSGYHIASVLVDGVEQGPIDSYTFTNVQAPHTIAAGFAADAPTPTPTPTPTVQDDDSGPTYIRRTLTSSSGTTLSGTDIHRSAGLTVRNLDENVLPSALREAASGGRMILGYDVSLSRGFRGSIDLSFPVGSAYEGQLVTILHYVNGKVETYTAVVTSGMATVTVNSLSPFVVLATGVTTPDAVVADPPKTGGVGSAQGLVMVLVALGGIAMLKRREAN